MYQLYLEAGTPRLKQIAEWAAMAGQAGMPGPDTVARIVGSATMPPSQADLVTVATVLARAARWDPDDAARRARDLWLAARMASARTPAAGVRVSQADPRLLGVHSAISVPEVPNQVPPTYVPRDADDGQFGVRAKIAAAAERGGFVLLVGGSSVGKTRSAFEAVTALLPDWWLVHPAGHGEVAALATAPMPRTVVWMDELQLYLDGEHGLTGGVVRALLNAPDPVVIIATIWPDRYTACTGLPASGDADPHARERQVLELAEVIRIAPAFSPAEQERACAAAARDQRLAIALESAGYGLTQTLAAAPQLVARWEDAQTASPYAWAVLTAALDAARLGARLPLSADFLRAAAPGYCTSQQQAEAPDNWLEQALAYATGKLYGAAAALSPTGPGMGRVAGYTVADYLIQHASRERRYARVPASTWDAILNHISDPADTVRLADSAERRLLYRYAIPLYRHAADAGDGNAASAAAALLYGRGDLDGLRARAAPGTRMPTRSWSTCFSCAVTWTNCAPGPTSATAGPPSGWPSCWPGAVRWMGCVPLPTPATGMPACGWLTCWPSAVRWTEPSRYCAPLPTPATAGPPSGWPSCRSTCFSCAVMWMGCVPLPTPATGMPPGGLLTCWPSVVTWMSCAPGPMPATGFSPDGCPGCRPAAVA